MDCYSLRIEFIQGLHIISLRACTLVLGLSRFTSLKRGLGQIERSAQAFGPRRIHLRRGFFFRAVSWCQLVLMTRRAVLRPIIDYD